MHPLRTARRLADAAFDTWQDARGRSDLEQSVGMGADGTPTSLADQLVEAAILEEAAAAGLSVLSEEAGFVDNGSPEWAVVDPLDGSRNAEHGVPFYCTSIAIADGDLDGLQAGVVRNLVTGDTYAAQARGGAAVNGKDVVRRGLPEGRDLFVGTIVDHLDQLPQRHPEHHYRDMGSSALELCLAGAGAFDAFVVNGSWLRVMDVAAGVLFVREAGGAALDPKGGDLNMPLDLAARTGVVAVHNVDALPLLDMEGLP
ncbi:MAG: inositol monophosphatase family protein [Thermoplasmatota archaeon]